MAAEFEMNVISCQEADQEQWDAYVLRCPDATLCHDFRWQAVIRKAYGHEAYYLMAKGDGGPRGILPLILVRSPFSGSSLTSMPFLDYGGVCADGSAARIALLEQLQALKEKCGAAWVELRHVAPIPEWGAGRQGKVSMILDLTGGEDQLWKALPAKVRNQVRKAEKAGLTIKRGGGELLGEFYPVFAVNMRDLGSPVHSGAFFEQMAGEFGERLHVILVKDGAKTVGGLIELVFKNTVLVPWASCLREYFSRCPNNLMYWNAIQESCIRGFKTFDFGRSTIGSGTYDFKRQWGAVPKQLSWQSLPEHQIIEGGPVSSSSFKYRMCMEIWKRLPVSVTEQIGPRIRKYLTN